MTETFFYGNRLKATIENISESRDFSKTEYLVTHLGRGKAVIKTYRFKSYAEAVNNAREYLNTCKY